MRLMSSVPCIQTIVAVVCLSACSTEHGWPLLHLLYGHVSLHPIQSCVMPYRSGGPHAYERTDARTHRCAHSPYVGMSTTLSKPRWLDMQKVN